MKQLFSIKKMLIFVLVCCCIGGIALGAGKVSGKSFTPLAHQQIKGAWYGSWKLPSPNFSFTGMVPAGATKLEIKRKGDAQTGLFVINTEKWSEFSLHFRLGYGNIEEGKNQYTLIFWEGEQLRGIGFLQLETHFQEYSFDDITLYLDESFSTEIREENLFLFPAQRATPAVLVKYGETFTVLTGPVLYNAEKELLYEGRNAYSENGNKLFYGDLYLNGKLLVKNVPVAYLDTGGENGIQFSYQPQQHTLDIVWADSDGCGQTFNMQSITLSTWEPFVEVHLFNHWLGDAEIRTEWPDGAVLLYQNKRLEVFPVIVTGANADTYALKYRYAVREWEKWKVKMEDFIVKSQIVEHRFDDLPCGSPAFSYRFDRDTKQLIVKRAVAVGGKAETYTRNLAQLPSYYRTSP